MFLVFSGVWTFLVDAYPAYAASAMAANVFTRCMFAGAFPLFGDQSTFSFPLIKSLSHSRPSSLPIISVLNPDLPSTTTYANHTLPI
jgi:hypothetical protein